MACSIYEMSVLTLQAPAETLTKSLLLSTSAIQSMQILTVSFLLTVQYKTCTFCSSARRASSSLKWLTRWEGGLSAVPWHAARSPCAAGKLCCVSRGCAGHPAPLLKARQGMTLLFCTGDVLELTCCLPSLLPLKF